MAGASRHRAVLGQGRCAHLPCRQSAHQTAAILGVADRASALASPRCDFFVGSIHAAEDDVSACQLGFSQSYTYFTWRNTKQEITDYFVELTTSDVKDFFRPHLVRQYARHQSIFPAVLWPSRISYPRGAGCDPVRSVGNVFGLRALRSRAAAGARGISQLRKIRDSRP